MAVNISQKNLNNDQDTKENQEKTSILIKINNYFLKFSRIPLKEKLFFVQHLGIMLKSGMSLSRAIETLSISTKNKRFLLILKEMKRNVEGGKSFSESLNKHEKVFGEMFVSMIEAGEASGKLEKVLHDLFIQIKKEHTLISKVKGALTYPAVIIVAMLGIGTFMMVAVVPRLIALLEEFDAELPLPTKVLIALSKFVTSNGIVISIGLVIFIGIIIKLLRTKRGRFISHTFLLKMPIISDIIKKINLARFARNISSLLQTDIMIVKSFQITAKVLGNVHYKKSLNEISQKIKKGEKISELMSNYKKLYPPLVLQMIAIGEETGELDNILIELAEFYEEEVNQIMDNLPSIIEPILILILGLGVGGVAVAIIMPMYSVTSSI